MINERSVNVLILLSQCSLVATQKWKHFTWNVCSPTPTTFNIHGMHMLKGFHWLAYIRHAGVQYRMHGCRQLFIGSLPTNLQVKADADTGCTARPVAFGSSSSTFSNTWVCIDTAKDDHSAMISVYVVLAAFTVFSCRRKLRTYRHIACCLHDKFGTDFRYCAVTGSNCLRVKVRTRSGRNWDSSRIDQRGRK